MQGSQSRGISARDEQRIQAAVARGAFTAARGQHWRVYAASGHDISFVDHLAGGLVVAGTGKADAAASQADADYRALFGPRARDYGPAPDYDALFGSTPQAARRALDDQEALASHVIASLTDDQLFKRLFGDGGSR